MSYNDFFQESENRKYIKFENVSEIEDVFNFLCLPECIDKMIMSSSHNRPALEGIIEDVELKFPISMVFNIEKDYTLRKALGSMVKYILSDFGYEVKSQKEISKGKYIKSATQYIFNPTKAKKKLIRTLTIENM